MKKKIRFFVFWVLIALFTVFVIFSITKLQNVVVVLRTAKVYWILLAAFIQLLYFISYSYLYKFSFRIAGIDERVKNFFPVLLSSLFVNVVAPIGGVAGSAYLVDESVRKGESASRATVGVMGAMLSEFSSFGILLIISILYLSNRGSLKTYELVSSLGILFIVVSIIFFMILGMWHPGKLHKVFHFFQRFVNKVSMTLRNTTYLADNWAHEHSSDFTTAVKSFTNLKRVLLPIFIAFIGHFLSYLSIFVLFLAFSTKVTPGVLLAGYSMGMLFKIVSPVPQGIGIVETIMVLVFTSLGIHGNVAAVVAVSYRGLTFWIPLLIGFALFYTNKSFRLKHE